MKEGLPITPIPRSNLRGLRKRPGNEAANYSNSQILASFPGSFNVRVPERGSLGTRLLRSNPSGLGIRTELSTSPLPQPHPVLQLCYRSKSSHGRPGSTSRAGGQDVCDYQAFSVYHGSPREETVLLGMGDRGKTVISR